MYALKESLQVSVGHVFHDECDWIADRARTDQRHDVAMVTNLLHQLDFSQ